MRGSGLALALIVAATATANADVLLLKTIEAAPPNSSSGVLRPNRGASMSTVRAQFGEPDKMMDAIGEPPITRWTYPTYTVYFEYQHVVDVVVHR
jgi:hypothetical protein